MRRFFTKATIFLATLAFHFVSGAQPVSSLAAEFQGSFKFAAGESVLSATLRFPSVQAPRVPLVGRY
jgi:hypothetical protein